MQGQIAVSGRRNHILHPVEWKDPTPRNVVGVLDGQGSRGCVVRFVGMYRGADVSAVEESAAADRLHLNPRQGRRCAGFVTQNVGALSRQQNVARPRQGSQRGLVAHGARRHEQRGLLSEQRSRCLLEPIHRRILPVDIVPDLCGRHCLPHGP